MDDEDYYLDHFNRKVLYEAMLLSGGFRFEVTTERRYKPTSPELSPIRRSISPVFRRGGRELLEEMNRYRELGEIAQKNAEALIKEEEQQKMKAKKKKEKKEKQKLKKLQAKEDSLQLNVIQENISNNLTNDVENLTIASPSDQKDGEELDINAAFVSKAVKKVKNSKTITDEPKVKAQTKDIDKLLKKAEDYERNQHLKEAVQYLSDAINLKPENIDLILKRSFIHFQLANFEKSIRDAKKVIKLSPNNPHAYYRLGEGYFALSNLTEAEKTFTKLLPHQLYSEEAKNRLLSIRIKQLVEMGYNPNEAFTALTKSKNKTLNEAIEFLIELEEGKHVEELYYSDEESEEDESDEEDDNDYESDFTNQSDAKSDKYCSGQSSDSTEDSSCPPIEISKNSSILTDPENPVGCCSLFVGNLNKSVITYKELHDAFTKFGEIASIKLTTDPNCFAFINYVKPAAAGMAMKALQGSKSRLSKQLLLKYPTKVVQSLLPSLKNPEAIMKCLATPAQPATAAKSTTTAAKSTTTAAKSTTTAVKSTTKAANSKSTAAVVQKPASGKPRPPPKTEECFYWRTIGCTYGNDCFNLHIPANKGVDLKQPSNKKKLCSK